jgi:hypothetical protein
MWFISLTPTFLPEGDLARPNPAGLFFMPPKQTGAGMSYTIKPITQYAVINDATGLPIALCKDRSEAQSVVNMMAGHGQDAKASRTDRLYTFADWARQ